MKKCHFGKSVPLPNGSWNLEGIGPMVLLTKLTLLIALNLLVQFLARLFPCCCNLSSARHF